MSKNLTTEGFIEKGKKVHGDKYDYSLVNYINNHIKVKIICEKHGVFEQKPNNHLLGQGCPKCGKEKASNNKLFTTEKFIEKAKLIHGNKYDYSLVNYVSAHKRVKIICSKHGIFEQIAASHIDSNQGCPKCGKGTPTNKEFIEKAKLIHGNKYDYSLVNYINNRIKIEVICPKHGIFNQKPNSHLRGSGCPSCSESNGEKTIAKYLDGNCINYVREYRFKKCKNKLPLPFDFYLSNNNTCIEYDGEQHFVNNHFFSNGSGFKYTKINDEIKNNFTKDNKIKLIRIKYNQIKNIENILNEELKIQ